MTKDKRQLASMKFGDEPVNDPTYTLSDWVTPHISNWQKWTESLRERRATQVLEVGSFEGRSTLAWLDLLPQATVTCVDLFGGTGTQPYFGDNYESRFDHNTAHLRSRIDKRTGPSNVVLPQLAIEGYSCDLIYIDAHHSAPSVYADAALSWPMLRARGILIFDDYKWKPHLPEEERPPLGVNAFLDGIAGTHEVLASDEQLVVMRNHDLRARNPKTNV